MPPLPSSADHFFPLFFRLSILPVILDPEESSLLDLAVAPRPLLSLPRFDPNPLLETLGRFTEANSADS